MKKAEDPRLAKVSAVCRTLPEAVRTDMGDHAAFTVRGRKFAYFLNDHHGDGIVSVCARAFPGENEALIRAHPRKFYFPAYITAGLGGSAARSRHARLGRGAGSGDSELSAGGTATAQGKGRGWDPISRNLWLLACSSREEHEMFLDPVGHPRPN